MKKILLIIIAILTISFNNVKAVTISSVPNIYLNGASNDIYNRLVEFINSDVLINPNIPVADYSFGVPYKVLIWFCGWNDPINVNGADFVYTGITTTCNNESNVPYNYFLYSFEFDSSNVDSIGIPFSFRSNNYGWYIFKDIQFMTSTEYQIFVNSQSSLQNQEKNKNEIINNQNSNQQQTNERLDETNQQLGELNNNITNENVDVDDSFFSGFESNDYGLTSIITAPLNLIKSITSATCTPLGFPAPFVNQNITLPCMGEIYQEYFGTFLTIYQTITFGMVAYWVSVKIFFMVKGFKDPDSDRIEVLDL